MPARVMHRGRPALVVDYHLLHVALRRSPLSPIYWAPISSISRMHEEKPAGIACPAGSISRPE